MSNYSKFLKYYHEEIEYLRNSGSDFSKKHPKLGKELHLGDNSVADPHVERIIESFAFLTSRLNKKIDDLQPVIARQILSILYPSLSQSMPSCAIAEFCADPTQGSLTDKFEIPKGKSLYANKDGLISHFTTVYPVTLWPITIEHVSIESLDEIRSHIPKNINCNHGLVIKLKCHKGNFSNLSMNSLTFHLSDKAMKSWAMYESIMSHDDSLEIPLVIKEKTGKTKISGPLQINELGLKDNETLLSVSSQNSQVFQIIRDYFHFPEKFLFFELSNLNLRYDTNEITLYIPIKTSHTGIPTNISKNSIKLGCSPVVNLYPLKSDPISYNHENHEYPLIADERQLNITEVHHVDNVFRTDGGDFEKISPYFFNPFSKKQVENGSSNSYWVSHNYKKTLNNELYNSTSIQIVDRDMNIKNARDETLFADIWCVNRHLCEDLNEGDELFSEESPPTSIIKIINRPVPYSPAPDDGYVLWYFISQLSHDNASITRSENAIYSIKNMLNMYASSVNSDQQNIIDSISSLKFKKSVNRVSNQAWCGFRQGIHMDISVRPITHYGASSLMMCKIINMYISNQMDSRKFFSSTVNQIGKDVPWVQWMPRMD